MIENRKIIQRLRILQFNLDDVNLCYKESLKDTYIECGLEYNKSYPLNDETHKLLNKQAKLEELQKDKLYTSIFNFTQAFYSVKEYLRKEFPQKIDKIEDFFSNEKIGQIARKDICNDLKHNPQGDLEYYVRIVSQGKIIEQRKQTEKFILHETWFYKGLHSVEHCNKLYKQLLAFIEENFSI